MKHWLLLLLLTVATPLGIKAQKGEVDKTANMEKRDRSVFTKAKELIVWYFNHHDYDTAYIAPPKFRYTLMMQQSANFEQYIIRSTGNKKQSLRFAPDQSYKLGAYFGWSGFFLGASVNMSDLFSNRNGTNKNTEYLVNLYGNKVGADFFFRRTGNDFKIRHADGFYPDDTKQPFNGISFNGLKVRSVGFNVYYVFNNGHFSYPAAYSQTTVQKISRGTLVAGISWTRHHLDFDHHLLPEEISTELSDDLKFKQVKYSNFNINMGYAFNWVFADNWLLAIALTPAIAYKASRIEIESTTYNQRFHNINLDFIIRSGLVYNNGRFFVGTSTVTHVYQYYQKNFALTDNFGVLNIYAGFNFGQRTK